MPYYRLQESSPAIRTVHIPRPQLPFEAIPMLIEYKQWVITLDAKMPVITLGIDIQGIKHVLGFWEGASEDHEVCEALLSDIQNRGLTLTKGIIWITDGGSGIIKALRDRFGNKVLHQRCVIHKDRNIQKHVPKKYRAEAHRRFMTAIEQNSYEDARGMLEDMKRWLGGINESAADSLQEAIEEILTVHRLKITGLLRTNGEKGVSHLRTASARTV